MRRIISQTTIIEVPETIETGRAAKLWAGSPYQITRKESDGVIIFYGYNVNWKFENGRWCMLRNSEFMECEEPEYEKIYQDLIKEKNAKKGK